MRRYTQEYRRALVDAVKSGLSARRVAWEHDVPTSTLRGWIKAAAKPQAEPATEPQAEPEPFDALPLFAQFQFPGKKWFYVKASEDTYHEDVPGFPALHLITRRPRADRLVVRAEPQLPNIPPPADRWLDWRAAVNASIMAARGERCDRPTWSELSAYFRTNYHPVVAAAEWMKSKPV
jgi:Transposase